MEEVEVEEQVEEALAQLSLLWLAFVVQAEHSGKITRRVI